MIDSKNFNNMEVVIRSTWIDIFEVAKNLTEKYTFVIFFNFEQKDFWKNEFFIGKHFLQIDKERHIEYWTKKGKTAEEKICFFPVADQKNFEKIQDNNAELWRYENLKLQSYSPENLGPSK